MKRMNKRSVRHVLLAGSFLALAAVSAVAQTVPPTPAQAAAGLPPMPTAISGPQPVAPPPGAVVAPSGSLERVIPALAKVSQIVIAEPSVTDPKVADDCHIDIKAVQVNLGKILATENMPVVISQTALRTDLPSVTLKPQIATLKDGVVNCISWVELKAESQATLALPPLMERKTVNVPLWNRGGLILTPVIDHSQGINNAFTILVRAFIKQYKLDNPDRNIGVAPSRLNDLNSLRK